MPSTASPSTKRTEPGPDPVGPAAARGRAGRPGFVAGLERWLGRALRPPLVAGPVLAARPGLLLLTAVLLVGLCALLAGWHARSPSPRVPQDEGARVGVESDFSLRADNSSRKLDDTSAEAPDRPSAPAPQPTVVEDRQEPPPAQAQPAVQLVQAAEPPLAPPPAPAVPEAPTLAPPSPAPPTPAPPEPAKLPEPAVAAPVVPPPVPAEPDIDDPLVDWHRGDVPMTRNWKRVLGYPALLAAALLATPAVADQGDSDAKAKKTDSQKLDEIQKDLQEIKKLAGSIEVLRRDLSNLQAEHNVEVEARKADAKELRDRIGQLESQLKALEARLKDGAGARQANFPPQGPVPGPAGRIRLVNNFDRRALVILNDRSYRLDPGRTEEVTVPAGAYTYEVVVDDYGSVLPRTTRTIEPNAVRTIEIFRR